MLPLLLSLWGQLFHMEICLTHMAPGEHSDPLKCEGEKTFVSGISCYLRHFLFCQDFCQHTHDAKKLCIGGFSKQMLIFYLYKMERS